MAIPCCWPGFADRPFRPTGESLYWARSVPAPPCAHRRRRHRSALVAVAADQRVVAAAAIEDSLPAPPQIVLAPALPRRLSSNWSRTGSRPRYSCRRLRYRCCWPEFADRPSGQLGNRVLGAVGAGSRHYAHRRRRHRHHVVAVAADQRVVAGAAIEECRCRRRPRSCWRRRCRAECRQSWSRTGSRSRHSCRRLRYRCCWPGACRSAVRPTGKSVYWARSVPAPPFSTSAPAPPNNTSLPSPPSSVSLPSRPLRISLPSPPQIVLAPALPRRLSSKLEPYRFSIET